MGLSGQIGEVARQTLGLLLCMASVSQVAETKERGVLGEEDRLFLDMRLSGDGRSLGCIPLSVLQGKGIEGHSIAPFPLDSKSARAGSF